MNVSVIATVFNEEAAIGRLLASLHAQTRPPDEIVIVDGGSQDRTMEIAREYAAAGAPVRLISLPGANISRGRNHAIAAATSEIIAATDAGVRLPPQWLQELTGPFASPQVDVVSGFFVADGQTVFETAMGATVLPQLADVNPGTFLPSSRSVAFTKEAWRKAGGYPEWLDYCEDLVFDLALRRNGCRFAFAANAVAYFRPRSSMRAFIVQYYRYARGDGKAGLWRKRHAIRYVTYVAAPLLFLLGLRYNIVWLALLAGALGYCLRPYQRLWPHLRQWNALNRLYALALVPIIRVAGDIAKMLGYPVGVWWRFRHRP